MYLENSFKKDIEDWFHKNQRDMPWRETTNPYYIWLSDVTTDASKHCYRLLL